MAGGHVARVQLSAARKKDCLLQYAHMDETQPKKQMSIMMLLGLLVVLTLVAGLLLSLSNIAKQQRMYSIFTFQECKDAGYPIMESYPEQCSTPDGRTFMNDSQTVQNIQVSTSTELDFNTSSPQAI